MISLRFPPRELNNASPMDGWHLVWTRFIRGHSKDAGRGIKPIFSFFFAFRPMNPSPWTPLQLSMGLLLELVRSPYVAVFYWTRLISLSLSLLPAFVRKKSLSLPPPFSITLSLLSISSDPFGLGKISLWGYDEDQKGRRLQEKAKIQGRIKLRQLLSVDLSDYWYRACSADEFFHFTKLNPKAGNFLFTPLI